MPTYMDRHDDVDADCSGLARSDPEKKLGEHASGPRPLPKARHARVVDVDDDDRRARADPGRQTLKCVEPCQTQPALGPDVGGRHEAHGQDEHQPAQPPAPSDQSVIYIPS